MGLCVSYGLCTYQLSCRSFKEEEEEEEKEEEDEEEK